MKVYFLEDSCFTDLSKLVKVKNFERLILAKLQTGSFKINNNKRQIDFPDQNESDNPLVRRIKLHLLRWIISFSSTKIPLGCLLAWARLTFNRGRVAGLLFDFAFNVFFSFSLSILIVRTNSQLGLWRDDYNSTG